MKTDHIVAMVKTHLDRYPQAGVADVYKLIHQAVFGPGHLIASKKAAREWLEQEFEQIAPAPNVSLLESIHPEGTMLRVHLRPYLACQPQPQPLLDAFINAAKQADEQRDPALMAAWWAAFEAACAPGAIFADRFDLREVQLFGRARAQEAWPAAHHSPDYIAAYQPRYRVLTRDEAERLCDKLRVPFEAI